MGLFATLRHIARLKGVEERLDSLEREFKALDMEWSDTYDELRGMLGKITKRKKFLERHEAAVDGEKPVKEGLTVDGEAGLTPTQAQAQREILARRRGAI